MFQPMWASYPWCMIMICFWWKTLNTRACVKAVEQHTPCSCPGVPRRKQGFLAPFRLGLFCCWGFYPHGLLCFCLSNVPSATCRRAAVSPGWLAGNGAWEVISFCSFHNTTGSVWTASKALFLRYTALNHSGLALCIEMTVKVKFDPRARIKPAGAQDFETLAMFGFKCWCTAYCTVNTVYWLLEE